MSVFVSTKGSQASPVSVQRQRHKESGRRRMRLRPKAAADVNDAAEWQKCAQLRGRRGV